MKSSIKRIKANIKDPGYFKMHFEKFEHEWMGWYSFWAIIGDHPAVEHYQLMSFVTIEKGFLFTIALLLLISVLVLFRKPIENFMYFCAITIAGYSALMFLVIRNPRYRFTAEGAIILLAGVGLCFLIDNYPNICKRIKTSNTYGKITKSKTFSRLAEKRSVEALGAAESEKHKSA